MLKLNGKEVVTNRFPNGELYFDNFREIWENSHHITWFYKDDSDIFELFAFKKYLDSMNRRSRECRTLTITYMPYSRMDRSEKNRAFTLKFLAELINSLGFDSVEIVEPHSDVSTALINNGFATYVSVNLFLNHLYSYINFNVEEDCVYLPDSGAYKRYIGNFTNNFEVLFGIKQRDFSTGKITKLEIPTMPHKDAKVVIIDDLCSRGGTFVQAAKMFGNPERLYLVVTHAEQTILEGDVFKNFKGVFITNSLFDESKVDELPCNLQVFDIEKLI